MAYKLCECRGSEGTYRRCKCTVRGYLYPTYFVESNKRVASFWQPRSISHSKRLSRCLNKSAWPDNKNTRSKIMISLAVCTQGNISNYIRAFMCSNCQVAWPGVICTGGLCYCTAGLGPRAKVCCLSSYFYHASTHTGEFPFYQRFIKC